MKALKILSILFHTFLIEYAMARQCPVPSSAIDVSIQENHEYDKKSQDYSYTYKVVNGPKAKLDVSMIQIETPQDSQLLSLPNRWKKEFRPTDGKDANLIAYMTSFNDIKPSSKPYIFKIKSKLPPGITRYYVEGMPSSQLKAITINNDDEAAPNCPGFYMNTTTILEEMITGVTVGPVAVNQVEVKLKIKVKKDKSQSDWDDESDEPEISPIDKGKIEVIMYGASNLDLALIDLKSIEFGPAKAKPLSSKIVTKSSNLEGWRKKPEDKNKMIMLEFKMEDLQIRCDLDKALFLKAKAGAKEIFGAVPIKSVFCDPKVWKQMGIERDWPTKPEED